MLSGLEALGGNVQFAVHLPVNVKRNRQSNTPVLILPFVKQEAMQQHC